MSTRTYSRSFAGGELSAHLFGRLDLAKYQTGLSLCRNFIVLPQGPVQNRPGTKLTREVKTSTKRTRLIPFTYSSDQTMVLEFGEGYIRFHTQGATLLSAGVPYEVVTPYAEADLFDLRYVQSADVMTIVHQGYAPRELRRLGPTNWTLSVIPFQPTISQPVAPTLAKSGPEGGTPQVLGYQITALAAGTLEESIASPPQFEAIDLTVAGNAISVTLGTPVAGAVRYNVYKLRGVYGYIGQIEEAGTLVDNNLVADTSKTPPQVDTLPVGDWPQAVGYYEQRRAFGGYGNGPQLVRFTRSGTEANLGYSIPAQADDAIAARIVAREAQVIRHLVPLGDMLAFTSGGVWRITSASGGPLTPSDFSARPQSYIGASNAQPVVTSTSVLYAAERGSHVREISYSWEKQLYESEDVSVMAPHLVDYHRIVQMAYSRAPWQILWAVREDGVLLGLTHMPEHEVKAWHQHVTDGQFESVCAVAEGDEDAVYFVVRRTVGGVQKRFVERMASRRFTTLPYAFFVDCGLTYAGAPATVISGLGHLEGRTVAILADGGVEPPQTVVGGQITLSSAASVVAVGLPYTSDLQTMPLTLEAAAAMGQGSVKNVNQVFLRVQESTGIQAGPRFDRLREEPARTADDLMGVAPTVTTGVVHLSVDPTWSQDGQVCVRQAYPVPLTLLSMAVEVAKGG